MKSYKYADIPWRDLASMPFLDTQAVLLNGIALGFVLIVSCPVLMVVDCVVRILAWVNSD